MRRRFVLALALATATFVCAGCTTTGASPADAAVNGEGASSKACIVDASVKLIQASDYDQSCKVDTDCQQIAVGNACVPCAFGCPLGGAISVNALAQYNSDVASTPAVGQGCPVVPCIATEFPCCIGGKCQLGSQCSNPTKDAAADTVADGADASTDAGARPCQGGFPPRDGDRVCAGAWFGCQETYAANDCQGKVCCVLPSDGGPPYLGDGGSCPGPCAMPDDIGCPMWYRSNVCVLGSLCCPNRPLDGGPD